MTTLLLTRQLNDLLLALHLPFTLQSPTDLTPSLLLAILESILHIRIPIDSIHNNTNDHHIQTTKIFLGILETDILRTDIGLSRIDPRLLASGNWDEVVYVAEVLCWIGRELGLLVDERQEREEEESISTTSPSSTITFLPPPPFTQHPSPPPTPTTTTLLFATEPSTTPSPPPITNPSTPPLHQSTTPIPRDDFSFTHQLPPIRRTGYISLVDHDSELSSFLSHHHSLSLTHPPETPSPSEEQDWRTLLATSPDYDPRRTYELLQKRTELMEELLRIRMTQQRPS